ncbi:putative kinase [Encephalitozoon cuniculi EcunIII-L]|uniref:Adenylate kinase isoenzyme 6 homolog n=1 Tax=Encephalitozoon cuniculi TaxID=6035 RepID=M1K5A9_ENCCN|nr:hypothetical protein ECU10_0960 [Encephalitozoon cuniculi]KMV65248.1 putative kinase [Encephalitozoon cuniculi EcunIII-L]
MKILVAGTPGVGKTTFSSRISEMFGIPHIEMSRYIEENNLYEEYSETYKSLLFDDRAVRKSLEMHVIGKDSYIVDTHSCGMVKGMSFDLIFLLTAPVEVLYKRLKKRGYDEDKIKENIECEIFGVVEEEVEEFFGAGYYPVGEEEGKLTPEEAIDVIGKKMNGTSATAAP